MKETKADICKQLGVTMEFEFVPWSQAKVHFEQFRTKDEPQSPTLAYKVKVYKDGNFVMETHYCDGGLVPSWIRPAWYGRDDYKSIRKTLEELVCEVGMVGQEPENPELELELFDAADSLASYIAEANERLPPPMGWYAPTPRPDCVLYCLQSDAMCVYHARNFEDFASELGYDSDSRTAERIYRACQDTYIAFSRHFVMDDLARLFENY